MNEHPMSDLPSSTLEFVTERIEYHPCVSWWLAYQLGIPGSVGFVVAASLGCPLRLEPAAHVMMECPTPERIFRTGKAFAKVPHVHHERHPRPALVAVDPLKRMVEAFARQSGHLKPQPSSLLQNPIRSCLERLRVRQSKIPYTGPHPQRERISKLGSTDRLERMHLQLLSVLGSLIDHRNHCPRRTIWTGFGAAIPSSLTHSLDLAVQDLGQYQGGPAHLRGLLVRLVRIGKPFWNQAFAAELRQTRRP